MLHGSFPSLALGALDVTLVGSRQRAAQREVRPDILHLPQRLRELGRPRSTGQRIEEPHEPGVERDREFGFHVDVP